MNIQAADELDAKFERLDLILIDSGDPAGMPTLYLQSCAGGMFEGDDLRLRVEAGESSSAHVTSGASTIVHSVEQEPAVQYLEIRAREDSFLEYLPDPNILFWRSRLHNRVKLIAHPGATAIIGDTLLLHDPKGGDAVFDWLRSETRIEDPSGKLPACDRFHIEGAQLARGLAGVAGTSAAQGSLFVVTSTKPAADLVAAGLVTAMRDALVLPEVYAGAALLSNRAGAWARILAKDATALKAGMFQAWAVARNLLTGAMPVQRWK